MKAVIAATLFAATGLALAEATPQRWTPEAIASDQYESSPTFSADGRELVFMRADPAFRHYRLLVSRCEHGGWSAPEPPPFAATAPVDEADPFISHDGRRLYYISTRDKPRTGAEADFDIWLVERQAGGRWGAPRRLPEPVNSTASARLPREDAQGRLLFGSSRPGGLGLGDI